MQNRLKEEQSLYLQQHKNQPVHWWPWCLEAFEAARKADKPIIVSIGYSSCHWCHVMARECFEDPFIADIMNRHYVCIKVDKEERPDLDEIYIEAVQMIQQHAGWPLNVFCLSDGRPFFGGTYFPPKDIGQGIVPWPQLLMRIHDFYGKNRAELEDNADNIIKNLWAANTPTKPDIKLFKNTDLIKAAKTLCLTYDKDWGGFGTAPKFPPTMILNFLLELKESATCTQGYPDLTQELDTIIEHTLVAMAHGGIYDQLQGGFCRYSVDRFWLIPHFEKMLYDNAQLIEIYAKAWTHYKNPLFKAIVQECVAWAETQMRLDNGLYAASINADSEGIEGKYYAWTPKEIKAILGEALGQTFCATYHISEEGNFEYGLSVPALTAGDFKVRKSLALAREKLLEIRSKRIPPSKDPKAVIAWNALMAQSLSHAGFIFNKPEWVDRALFILDKLWAHKNPDTGRLPSIIYTNDTKGETLQEQAYFAQACLNVAQKADWTQPGASKKLISWAETITQKILSHYKDPHQAGYFLSPNDQETLLVKKKQWWDNALPSSNASMAHVLSQLHLLTGKNIYQQEYLELEAAYISLIKQSPQGVGHTLSAIASKTIGMAVIKSASSVDWALLQTLLSQKPYRTTFVLLKESSQGMMHELCVGTQCMEPSASLEALVEFL